MKPSSMPLGTPKTLLKIEFDVVCLEFCKGLFKIDYEVVSPFGLDHDVINVGLNGSPDEAPETFEHTTLVRSLAFFRPNGIVTK